MPLHCIENAPCNPDKLLVQCDNCQKWLHGICLEQAAVREAYKKHGITYPGEETEEEKKSADKSVPPKTPAKPLRSSRKSTNEATINTTPAKPARAKKGDLNKATNAIGLGYVAPEDLLFTAEVLINENEKTKLLITDHRPGQKSCTYYVALKCLLCHENIDQTLDIETESEVGVSIESIKEQLVLGDKISDTVPDNNTPDSEPIEDRRPEKKDSVMKDDEPQTTVDKDTKKRGGSTKKLAATKKPAGTKKRKRASTSGEIGRVPSTS